MESVYIFRFASLIFPDNPNVWDSLGEALLKNGDISEGLDMYRKSLTLNPNNEAARQLLETYNTTGKNNKPALFFWCKNSKIIQFNF